MKLIPVPIPIPERFAIPIPEAGQYGGWGRSKTYELIEDGRLETIKIDGKRLVVVASLLRLLESARATSSKDGNRPSASSASPA